MITLFIPKISSPGGTERAAINLINMLTRSGHIIKVYSICTNNGNPFYPLDSSNIDICHLGMADIPVNFFKKFFWFFVLYRTIKRLSLSGTIIGTGHNINCVLSMFESKKKHINIIGCEHIDIDTIPKFSKFFMNLFYRRLYAIVLLSDIAKNKFIKAFGNGFLPKLIVIPNALPFNPIEKSCLNKKNIIMVGRIDNNKGYDRLIPIAKYLKNQFPEWIINIYGSGEEEPTITKLFESNNLNNIIIHKPVTNIETKYLDSSIFIMTSHSEAMPMVILEANICGLPVIAYENEGVKCLIQNGFNGYIIKDNDFDSFNSTIDNLINDSRQLRTLSRNAISFASRFTNDTVFKCWRNLLFENDFL